MSREKIQESVDRIINSHSNGIDFDAFQALLQADKIEVLPYAPGGVLKGVSYSFDNFKWPGSKLGRQYSAGLIERGIQFGLKADSAPAPSLQLVQPLRPLSPAPITNDRYNRVPPMVRKTVAKNFDVVEKQQQVWADQSLSPGQKSLLSIGILLFGMTAYVLSLAKQLIEFLLAKVGLRLEPARLGSEQADTALPYRPAQIAPGVNLGQQQSIHGAMNEVAPEIQQLEKAIRANDPGLLPDSPVTAELAAAMTMAESTTAGRASAADATVDVPKTTEIQQSSVAFTPPKFAALEALKQAAVKVREAELKVEGVIWLDDSTQVKTARLALEASKKALADARARDARERSQASAPARWLMSSAADVLKPFEKALADATGALSQAQKNFPPSAPANLHAAVRSAAREAVEPARLAAAELKSWAETISDPEVQKCAKQQVSSFCSLTTQAEQSLQPGLFRQATEAGFAAIKNVAARQYEVERAKLARLMAEQAQAEVQANANDEDHKWGAR